jgi:alginate O-acetyltransferase complex protein AlgI
MSVSSAPFFVFLILVCLLLWLTARWRQLQIGLLALANLFFLARFSLVYLALPLAASIDFLVGLGLGRFRGTAARRLLLAASLTVNLGLLAGLKMLPLVTGSALAMAAAAEPIVLLLSITYLYS